MKVGVLYTIPDPKEFVRTGETKEVAMLMEPDLIYDCRDLTPGEYARIRPELATHAKVVAWTSDGMDVLSQGRYCDSTGEACCPKDFCRKPSKRCPFTNVHKIRPDDKGCRLQRFLARFDEPEIIAHEIRLQPVDVLSGKGVSHAEDTEGKEDSGRDEGTVRQ